MTISFSILNASAKNEYEYIKERFKQNNPNFYPWARQVSENLYEINKDYKDLIKAMRIELEKRKFRDTKNKFFQKKVYADIRQENLNELIFTTGGRVEFVF